MELFIYLLKVTGCTAAFYSVYYILFRKLTFFSLNRWYLISTLTVSMLIPLLHINVQTLAPARDVKPLIINTTDKTVVDDAGPAVLQQATPQHINWVQITTYIYITIAAILLIRLLINLGLIIHKAIKYGKRDGSYLLIAGPTASNSSFFNFIFFNNRNLTPAEKEQVIAHEIIHAQKLHSADNLLVGLLKVTLWFNPFIYLFGKALCQTHEFEVDRCLAEKYNSKTYAGLLLKLSLPGSIGLSNQFSAYGLKSRIGMLFSKPSATANKLSYFLVIPLTLLLVYFLTVEKVYAFAEDTTANKNFVLVLDAGHGGKEIGVRTASGEMEKDLALQMVKQIKAVADARGIKTILTRADDQFIALKDRLIPQGDAFVSVHVNWAAANNTESGIQIITSNKNVAFARSQKLAEAFTESFLSHAGRSDGFTNINMASQNVLVLRENRVPAVLLEIGYLSNKKDLKYISDKQNQHLIAEQFIDAIIAYKKEDHKKLSGKESKPDTGLKVSFHVDLLNKENHSPANSDTALKTQNSKKGTTTPRKKDFTSMKITSYRDDDKAGDNLYNNFNQILYSATDSTLADHQNNTLYLYGGAKLKAGKFNISAKFIKINSQDSILTANGNVKFKINNPKKPIENTAMDLDSLSIDMRTHLKKPTVTKH